MKKVFLVVALALLIGGMAMADKDDNNGQNGQNANYGGPYCIGTGEDQVCSDCVDDTWCSSNGFGSICCDCGGDKDGRCVGSENACSCPVLG